MAISFSNQPTGIYPAYNDSFVELSSDIEGSDSLEIVAYPVELFPKSFIKFPDLEGNFLFNLKQVMRVLFGRNGFSSVDFEDGVFWGSFSGSYLLQNFDFNINNGGVIESVTKSFEFYKGVKQVGDFLSDNKYKLFSYSEDGINHSLTYFEGFPFCFSVQKIEEGTNLVLKNKNTGFETEEIEVQETNSFKFVVDDGVDNWTNKNMLPLTSTINKIELFADNDFKTNINIRKKTKASGVYLRWFNSEGEFSYYLFDEYYREVNKSKSLGRVYDVDFKNIGESTGNSRGKGKESSKSKRVKANFDCEEYGVLNSILNSPHIQMYTSEKAFIKGRFIDVDVDGTLNYRNKRSKNEITLEIELIKPNNIIL